MPVEHKTTYLPVSYKEQQTGVAFFKKKELPLEPDVAMFFETKSAQKHLNEIQADGYELLTVAPILKAVVMMSSSSDFGPSPYGFAYPLTAGFALFWKRYVSEQV
jgi:hypothetical protein